jgi:hypothetical protein
MKQQNNRFQGEEALTEFNSKSSGPNLVRESVGKGRALRVFEDGEVKRAFTRIGSAWVPLPENEKWMDPGLEAGVFRG